MKAFIIGIAAAIALAVIVAIGLNAVDKTAGEQYSTENVRL
jgi:hypothetical protein